MKIKVYMPYLKLEDFLNYDSVLVKPAYPNQNDVEVILDTRKMFMLRQASGILIKRKRWYNYLPFFRKFRR